MDYTHIRELIDLGNLEDALAHTENALKASQAELRKETAFLKSQLANANHYFNKGSIDRTTWLQELQNIQEQLTDIIDRLEGPKTATKDTSSIILAVLMGIAIGALSANLIVKINLTKKRELATIQPIAVEPETTVQTQPPIITDVKKPAPPREIITPVKQAPVQRRSSRKPVEQSRGQATAKVDPVPTPLQKLAAVPSQGTSAFDKLRIDQTAYLFADEPADNYAFSVAELVMQNPSTQSIQIQAVELRVLGINKFSTVQGIDYDETPFSGGDRGLSATNISSSGAISLKSLKKGQVKRISHSFWIAPGQATRLALFFAEEYQYKGVHAMLGISLIDQEGRRKHSKPIEILVVNNDERKAGMLSQQLTELVAFNKPMMSRGQLRESGAVWGIKTKLHNKSANPLSRSMINEIAKNLSRNPAMARGQAVEYGFRFAGNRATP